MQTVTSKCVLSGYPDTWYDKLPCTCFLPKVNAILAAGLWIALGLMEYEYNKIRAHEK